MPVHSFSSPVTALKRAPHIPTPVRLAKAACNSANSANTDPNEHLDSAQFAILKGVVARTVIQLSTAQKALETSPAKGRKARARRAEAVAGLEEGDVHDEGEEDLANDLEEFVLYLAEEVWAVLPEEDKSFPERKPTSPTVGDEPEKPNADTEENEDETSSSAPAPPAPPAFTESLLSYSLVASESNAADTFKKVVTEYRQDLADAPPDEDFVDTGYELPGKGGWWATRKEECEICGRNCPLSYHHLIPRSTHTKVLRKKWHPPERLNVVAWLCRSCHSAVHRSQPNEVLAKNYYTVDLIMTQEVMQRWAVWCGRQRYGKRRG